MSQLDSRLNPNLFPTPNTNPTTARVAELNPLDDDSQVLDERVQRFIDAGFDVDVDSSSGQITIVDVPE